MALRKLHNESELLNRIANDDEQAFALLFKGYYNQIGEYIQLLTGDKEATQEIVQETLMKIWINRKGLPQVNRFDSYLFIICRNHALNYIRKAVAERCKQEEYVRVVETTEDPGEMIEPENFHGLIEKAVGLLPPQQQKVFILRQQGLKNPEISQQMNLSIESVKKYQHLAMCFIREFVRTEALVSVFWGMLFYFLGHD